MIPLIITSFRKLGSGNFLLSRAVSRQVPSTLKSLTSVFGMGTGGSSLLSSPDPLLFLLLEFTTLIVPSKLNNANFDVLFLLFSFLTLLG